MTTQTRPALEFDGIDDYIDCGEASAHRVASAFTLEAWIYIDSWRPRAAILGKHLDGNGDEAGYALQLGDDGNLRLALRTSDGDMVEAVAGAPGSLAIASWHHVAGTFDGTTMRVFVDGAQVGEQAPYGSDLSWFPEPRLFIALNRDGDEEHFFHGKIGQVRVWDRAKDGAEISAGMNVRANGDEPGPGGTSPEEIRRERLAGRAIPSGGAS